MHHTAKLSFYGGVGTATGANFLLEADGKRIVIDCGFLQGVENAESFNAKPFAYDPLSVDAVIITHAHADHIGRLPKLVKDGFRGPIYSTPATKSLAAVMLEDTAEIMRRDAEERGSAPLYDMHDVQQTLSMWSTVDYYRTFDLEPHIFVTFHDAGHILGSAIVYVTLGDPNAKEPKRIMFTGDLGNSPSLFLRDTDNPIAAQYAVMESVYGDRNHEPKAIRRQKLEKVIKETVEEKRTLIIPAFSLERTQDILYEINQMVEGGAIQPVPVFIDSPLATKVTNVYRQYTNEFKDSVKEQIAQGDDVFDFSRLKFTARMEESVKIAAVENPKIIIAGSGMSAGGRILNHEQRYLPDPNATVLFVGYQAVNTLGRRIIDGATKVEVNGQLTKIRARIETIFGYSSHKDSDHLVEFMSKVAEHGILKTVFPVMGEPKSSMHLAQRLDAEDIHAVYPELGQTITLFE